mgnify:CR=1 FL=1
MPQTDAEVRSRERRDEVQQQQELLNQARDDNSIFNNGQMEGDNAKDWMSSNPGDAFLNLVKLGVEHHAVLIKLIEFNNSNTQNINDINESLNKIDEDINELEKKYRTLISTVATKGGSVGVKLIRKGSIKKSKKKYNKKSKKKSKKKKKSTKRKRTKKRR